MNKKGVFEIQFNWIFIMAVGAIILLFFSVIILRQKDISEVATSDLITKNLDAIFSGAEVSLRTVNLIDIPNVEMEFSCNSYRIGKVSRQIDVLSIFTPNNIKSSKLITWTLDWSLPYRVTNLLYLTSPKIRYVFVGNSDLSKKTFELIPNETNKDIYANVKEIVNKDDDKVRIIFFDGDVQIPAVFDNMPKDTVTALEVNEDEDKGQLNFFKINNNELENIGTSYYIREPTLLGAVFAEDIEIYDCAMKNSFNKLNIISQVYFEKTSSLKDFYGSQSDSCEHYHNLNSINNIIQASRTFSSSSINTIDSAAKALEHQNKQAQLFSCALIY